MGCMYGVQEISAKDSEDANAEGAKREGNDPNEEGVVTSSSKSVDDVTGEIDWTS